MGKFENLIIRVFVYGVPFGTLFGLFQGFRSNNWTIGVLAGFVGGVFFGFFVNLFRRQPTFIKAEKRDSRLSDGLVERTYRLNLSDDAPRLILVGVAGVLVSFWVGIEDFRNFVLFGSFFLIAIILNMLATRKTLLRISVHGIEYQSLWYRISGKWNDIQGVEMTGNHGVLVFSQCDVKAGQLTQGILAVFDMDKKISLQNFPSWRVNEIGETIGNFIPAVKLSN